MKISQDLIGRLEALAALRLDAQERESLCADLGRILEYVRQLEQLQVDDVDPTVHVTPAQQPLRRDATRESMRREEVQRNAPDARDGFYRVPRFIAPGEES
jgi:aspartyl-tRNA(Asn)/glutamyl-tRNA(Gln) amidotransferase subunit C